MAILSCELLRRRTYGHLELLLCRSFCSNQGISIHDEIFGRLQRFAILDSDL